MKTGIVKKSTGSWYKVRQEDGSEYNCVIKGRFRIAGIKSTNPVAVGDRVDFEFNDEEETGVITKIYDRKNYIVRRSPNLSKQSHIIAANIDQAFLITTINYPVTSTTFIDRFLSTAEAYQVPASIIFNKVDRYGQQDLKLLEEYKAIYEPIGYPCYIISAKTGEKIDQIKALLKEKTTLLAGHSGVGKSTLINTIDPQLHLKTAEISDYHQTGKHTTTFSEMHLLEFGGAIIDTPGIRGFGTFNLDKEEIHHFFPEIFKTSENCQFYNCLHTHEPGCAVKNAVEEGIISASRYKSYLNILADTEDPNKYR